MCSVPVKGLAAGRIDHLVGMEERGMALWHRRAEVGGLFLPAVGVHWSQGEQLPSIQLDLPVRGTIKQGNTVSAFRDQVTRSQEIIPCLTHTIYKYLFQMTSDETNLCVGIDHPWGSFSPEVNLKGELSSGMRTNHLDDVH